MAMTTIAMTPTHAVEYTARSPAHRVALVELYTSEGCSSCPPADAWLAKGAKARADRWVPLALHVDYWNNLGWKDRFSNKLFTERQQDLSAYTKSRVIYTPEVFVAGRELRKWGSADAFNAAISNTNTQAANADIALKLSSESTPRTFDLTADVKLRSPTTQAHVAYVAVYENKLATQVASGENGGVTLRHDYVVRRWLGPFALQGGVAQIHEKIALDSIGTDVRADHFGIVAFVQNASSGEVLQVATLSVER